MSPLNTVLSIYLLIGFVLGIYVVWVAPGTVVVAPAPILRDLITTLLYLLLWPFFLFGNLEFRLR